MAMTPCVRDASSLRTCSASTSARRVCAVGLCSSASSGRAIAGIGRHRSMPTTCLASSSSSGPALLAGISGMAHATTAAWKHLRQQADAFRFSQTGAGTLLAMAAIVPPTLSGSIADLLSNKVFMAGFWGFLFAQVGKIFTERYKRGYWDIKHLVAAGGMPSSHSSLTAGVTTALAMVQGFGSPVFACATAFTLVVMYDAMGVRRHAGMHAQVLNRVVDEIQYDVSLGSVADLELKEVLGHTPRQVLAGALLGITVGVLYPLYF